jgi:hypothetical protein
MPETLVPLACQGKIKSVCLGQHWQASGTRRISVPHEKEQAVGESSTVRDEMKILDEGYQGVV